MKLISTSLLLAGLCAVSTSSVEAQNSRLAKFLGQKKQASATGTNRMLNVISRPGTSMNYVTDMMGGWLHYSNSTYTYDAAGRTIEKIDRVPDTNANIYKFTNAYDAQNNSTEVFAFDWDGSQWVMTGNSFKSNYTYNGANQITQFVVQDWNPAAMAFENDYRFEISYNQDGFINTETMSDWTGTGYEITQRNTYSYTTPGVPPTGITLELMQGGVLVPQFRYTNITWHNFDEYQALGFFVENWNGSVWELKGRTTITYDQYGGSIETIEGYDNGTWEVSGRTTETYDTHSNFTGSKGETWLGSSWMTDYENQEVLTYNANNDITQRVFRNMFNINGTLEDDRKEVYDNFVYITAAPANTAELPVFLFPNPTAGKLQVTGTLTGAATVTVTDLTGRLLLNQSIELSSAQLDLANLPAGTYLLHIGNQTGSKTTKIVKL